MTIIWRHKTRDIWLTATLLWLAMISWCAVQKYAPAGVNADVMMNSIMSLQRLTLYYWGQNRLVNVLPLIVWPIRDPATNLTVVIYLSACGLFGLLLLISRYAARVFVEDDTWSLTFKVFVSLTLLFLSLFNSDAIAEIALRHVEYSFSALAFGSAIYALWNMQARGGWRLILAGALVFLSMSLNPSTIIPAVLLIGARIFCRRGVESKDIVIGSVAFLSGLFWVLVSVISDGTAYSSYSAMRMVEGLKQVLIALINCVNPEILLGLLVLMVLARVWDILHRTAQQEETHLRRLIVISVVAFALFWVLLFSGNRWVEMNQFPARYFIYVFFALLVLSAVDIAWLFLKLRRSANNVLVSLLAASAVVMASAAPQPFDNYAAFARANALTSPEGGLYAGDYWLVWPSVLRDLMAGKPAFGVTYRGEVVSSQARLYADGELRNHGSVAVHCLHERKAVCINAINTILGPATISQDVPAKPDVEDIVISGFKTN